MQSHFSLSFKIASGPSQNLSLLISNAKPIPLTPPAKLDQGDHGANTEDQREKILSRISDPFAVRSPAGETDGISLPWFSEADAALLHAYVSNGHMYVTLFTRWSDDRQLEIRAYGDDWVPFPQEIPYPTSRSTVLSYPSN